MMDTNIKIEGEEKKVFLWFCQNLGGTLLYNN